MEILSPIFHFFFAPENLKTVLFVIIVVAFGLWVKRGNFLKDNTEKYADLQLGYVRFLTCSICLFLAARDNPLQTLGLPIEFAHPRTFIHLLLGEYWIDAVRSEPFLRCLWYAALFSLACAAVGFLTRLSLVVGAVTFFFLYDLFISFTHVFHSGLLPLQLLILLVFLPCGDRISIDTLLWRRNISTPSGESTYRYSLYLCWIVYAMAYLNAGLSKVGAGVPWFTPSTMLGYIAADSLSLIQYDFNLTSQLTRVAPDWILTFGAIAASAIECSALLLIINRKAMKIIPILICGLHLFIFAIHEFPFFDLLFLPLMFFPISKVLLKTTDNVTLNTEELPSDSYRWAVCCCIVATILISPQIHKVKFFPILDTWDMYSVPQLNQHATYFKVFRVGEDGIKIRTDFQDTFSMFREAKWQDVLLYDEAHGFRRLERLLPSILKQYPDMKEIIIERWRWNFGSDRVTGNEGTLEQTWTINAK